MEVRRDSNFTRLAVRITMKTNIVWMSGDYKWSRAYLMNFIPYKAKGHFNIDLKSVEIGFITVYKMTDDLGPVYLPIVFLKIRSYS